jgi:hypothetical protein
VPDVFPQPSCVSRFIERACCQSHDGLGGICLAGLEVEAVEFEEENADHKPRPLVAIDERMVPDDAGCLKSGHFDNIRSAGIGAVLAGKRKSGLQKTPVTQAGGAAVERQEAIVDREHIALIDPEGFFTFHFCFFLL